MIVVTSEHAGHDPDRLAPTSDTRRYWEVPDRADTLLATVRNRGFSVRPDQEPPSNDGYHWLGPGGPGHAPRVRM